MDNNQKYIKIKDDWTTVTLGQWLNLLPSEKQTRTGFIFHLEAEEYLEKAGLDDKMREIIANRVFTILKSTELINDESITISTVDQEKYQFNCHLNNRHKDIPFNITWGNIDFLESLKIDSGDTKKEFGLICSPGQIPYLKPEYEETVIPANNAVFKRRYGFFADLSYETVNNVFKYSVHRNDEDPNKDDIFILENEEAVKEYIASLQYPVDINKVFADLFRLANLGKYPLSGYLSIHAQAYAYKDNSYKLTDEVSYFQGKLVAHKSLTNPMPKEEIERLNKINYCIEHDLDTSLVDSLTDFEFTDLMWQIDEVAKKEKEKKNRRRKK